MQTRHLYSNINAYICGMKAKKLEIKYEIRSIDELGAEDRKLVDAAIEATQRSYAPYSRFHVGAAALLENDVIVTGTNQENVAYPSGLCAERTALFYANSQYPYVPVKALAIIGISKRDGMNRTPLSPCGACRQVMLETENRFATPMRVLLCGKEEVYIVESAKDLLPFAFDNY